MQFTPAGLAGAYLIQPRRFEDERGYFAQVWDEDAFARHGLATRLVHVNTSFNRQRGTLRGMHFQIAPHAQAKVVRCIRGALYDAIIDLRPESPTYMRWAGFELSAANGHTLYVPEGCAHGFQTLEDNTEIMYQVNAAYAPHAEGGVRYDDPAFDIPWPLEVTVVSDKDTRWPLYRAGITLSHGH